MSRPWLPADHIVAASGVDADRLAQVCPRVNPAKVKVREAPWWLMRLWPKGISAMATPWALYATPQVIDRCRRGCEPRRNGALIVHELMHLEQLAREGTLRHIVRYVADYLRGRLRGLGHWDAYRSVGFEEEARAASRLVMGASR
jgi:hypothetical protein